MYESSRIYLIIWRASSCNYKQVRNLCVIYTAGATALRLILVSLSHTRLFLSGPHRDYDGWLNV
jgi:hypothetical protein